MSSTKLVTAATFEPVAIDDVKQYLRLDTDDDLWFLERSITACRIDLEQKLRRALPQQTLQSIVEFDIPPVGGLTGYIDYTSGKVEVPFPPLISIGSVSMETFPGTFTVCDPSTYYVDTSSEPALVWIQATAFSTVSLPVWTVWTEPFYPRIQIVYTCGYSDAGSIPQDLKDMLLEMIAFKYQFREGPKEPPGLNEEIMNRRVYYL